MKTALLHLNDFREEVDYIEKEIREALSEGAPFQLYDAASYLMNAGGKRIRPLLVLLSARAASGKADIKRIAPIAVAVELIHTATIIHDDIIDKSEKRRGIATVNKKWGENTAILAGDMLFSKSFELIGTHEIRELSGIVGEACESLAQGEMLELLHIGNASMTEEVYLEILERKTAHLFEACAECGAILGGAGKSEVEALSKFGYFLGISFQLIDDILDITGDEKLGKPIGIDIKQKKITLALIHALKNSRERERKIISGIIEKEKKTKKDIEKISKLLSYSGSFDYAFKKAEYFAEKAKKELKIFKSSSAKSALQEIGDSAVYREF